MSVDLRSHKRVRVGRLVEEILAASDALRGAAALLEREAELRADAEPEALSGAATGVRAAAMHALSVAAGAVGAAARLDAYAGLPESEI